MERASGLVIDCHGHFTTEPSSFLDYGDALRQLSDDERPESALYPEMSDDELSLAIADNQLRLQRLRGTDVTLLSPRASAMGHDRLGPELSDLWARLSNDTISRICELFPENFAPVCQLPQSVNGSIEPLVYELERCVDMGFVGVNLNPDPSGGRWSGPALTDEWWDPLWSALERLKIPAMIHAAGSASVVVHTTGAHYLAADTIAFMQLLQGDVFTRFPGARVILPHGGGAVPYHWGRYRGLALAAGRGELEDVLLRNVFFDTCIYHASGIELLFKVIPVPNILFGSELLGAMKHDDPQTGAPFDDTLRYIDALELPELDRDAVLEQNARIVFPLLDARLKAQGR